MTTSHRPLTVVEDGGLAALTSTIRRRRPERDPATDPETLQAVRDLLLSQLDAELLDPVAPANARDPEVLRVLRAEIGVQTERSAGPLRDLPTDEQTLLRLFQETLGWGPAQAYLDDERVQEVKIIGNLIMVQEDGADFMLAGERFSDGRQALDRALLLASRLNVALDRSRPQETLPLAHGTRVHVSIPPCTPEHTALICIRRGRRQAWTLDDIERRGACNTAVADLLRLLVRAGCSFLIAGETGCGKTALLEALVNTWPGEPHVITIEDNTQEINVRHAAWTRELVQTAVEPGAFGRAAKEVLRQTPSVVAPGETRASEAGAILAVAVSGHAVVTTIHARTAARAVQRFADCAAMPGAYLYEGRRDNAIEDACDNFHVVLHLEKVGGRRYINEILLLDGSEEVGGRIRPRTVRLAWVEPSADAAPIWHTAAGVSDNGLVWNDERRTPEQLARRLSRLRFHKNAPTTVSRTAVEETISRATLAIRAGAIDRALAGLRRAWAERRDERLAATARHALAESFSHSIEFATQGRALEREILSALEARRWDLARASYERAIADLGCYAGHTPAGGWDALAQVFQSGEAADREATQRVSAAWADLANHQSRRALDRMSSCDAGSLSPGVACELLRARHTAMENLCAAGEIGREALEPVAAALTAAERAIEHRAD
ncbi:MAG: Flp pilus assembly complex ATPase component TadA [Oscillochloris sp.]|nr:Flp pilus assembly complex ATPase component TadA [Oscillochloris sp.]